MAEIDPARQFAHHEDVYAVALPLRAQRARVRQRLGELHRTQVSEQAKLLADAQQGGALGSLLLRNRRVAVRQAYGAEEDGIALLAQRERRVGQRLAGGVNARPAHGGLSDLETQGELLLHRAQDLDGLVHHFGTDAVTRERGDLERL